MKWQDYVKGRIMFRVIELIAVVVIFFILGVIL